MGQALYRKYRSRSLAEVVGQEHITNTLGNAIKSGRISHAYLFTGPRGTGKTSIARILAHEINKIPYSDETKLDIIEIDAASNRRIDDIRELREKVHTAPVNAPYKVYIIDEVHMLTGESFNALLKTLEEPPAHVVFILATTESHKLPATIISRTQRFTFRLIDKPKMIGHLKYIADQEKIKITDDALQIVAEHGGGAFRDSISLLDQVSSITEGEITAEHIQQTLGLAKEKTISSAIECLLSGDYKTLGEILNSLENTGVVTSAFVNQLAKQLAVEAVKHPQFYDLIDQLLDVPRAYNPKLKMLAVLLGFAAQGKQNKPAAKTVAASVAPPATLEKPIVQVKKEPVKAQKPAALAGEEGFETPSAVTKTEPKIETPKLENATKLNTIDLQQWAKVMEAVKKINVPLSAVLKHAVPLFDADKQKLTLAFKWQLHRKKLDDVKQRLMIVQIVAETMNADIEVETSLDKDAQMPIASDDPTVVSVANIMGGGQVVNLDGAQ